VNNGCAWRGYLERVHADDGELELVVELRDAGAPARERGRRIYVRVDEKTLREAVERGRR
jgi:hypothetical protein